MFAAINNIHKAIFQWPSLNSDIMMKLSNILKAFLALQVTIARSDDGGIGYDDEKNSKLYDVNYDPFDDINHEVEPFGHRELQLSPSTAACIDACRTEEQLKRTTCFNSYCNDKFPNNVGSATWKEDRKRCKGLCRVAYRQKFATCKARCRVAESFTVEEQEDCDNCPCCAAGGDFLSTMLEPDLCFWSSDGSSFCSESETNFYRCVLSEDDTTEGISVDFTEATELSGSVFDITHTYRYAYGNDELIQDCPSFETKEACPGRGYLPEKALACSRLADSIRTRLFGDKCGQDGYFGEGADDLPWYKPEHFKEYCETLYLVP